MRRNSVFSIILIVFGVLTISETGAWGTIPLVINHQGVVKAGGEVFTGSGQFRFAFVDSSSGNNLWTNDGTNVGIAGIPSGAIALHVEKGLYNVLLGDTASEGMAAIPNTVFNAEHVLLRIWFDDGAHGVEQLTPDQPVTSAAYAIKALNADRAATADQAANAALLDGQSAANFAPTAHDHALETLSGAVTDEQVPDDITIAHAAAAGDADTVDGSHAADFMPAGTDNWVNTAGDTVTGNLLVDGLLGLGYSRPYYKLEVNGDARIFNDLMVLGEASATNFVFQDAQTRWLSVSSAAFVRNTPTTNCSIGNGFIQGLASGADILILAPVSLPDGARITGYTIRCKDSDATKNLSVFMARQTASGASIVTNSSLSTSGSPGLTTLSSTTIDLVVDNEDYSYLIQAEWSTPSTISNIALYHVHVRYTVNDARP